MAKVPPGLAQSLRGGCRQICSFVPLVVVGLQTLGPLHDCGARLEGDGTEVQESESLHP